MKRKIYNRLLDWKVQWDGKSVSRSSRLILQRPMFCIVEIWKSMRVSFTCHCTWLHCFKRNCLFTAWFCDSISCNFAVVLTATTPKSYVGSSNWVFKGFLRKQLSYRVLYCLFAIVVCAWTSQIVRFYLWEHTLGPKLLTRNSFAIPLQSGTILLTPKL